jgi:hypothetical protein
LSTRVNPKLRMAWRYQGTAINYDFLLCKVSLIYSSSLDLTCHIRCFIEQALTPLVWILYFWRLFCNLGLHTVIKATIFLRFIPIVPCADKYLQIQLSILNHFYGCCRRFYWCNASTNLEQDSCNMTCHTFSMIY